jgi:hypothetical protein
MAEKDEQQIQVEETADGAAVVQVPDNFIPVENDPNDGQQAAKPEGDADGDDADHPDDTEAVRAARRARRRAKKDLARRSVEEKDARLQELQRANRELNDRLSRMEQRGAQYDIDRIDRSLEDANVRFEYAKMRLAEATQAGDGDAVAEAQGQWYEARQQLDQIANLKRQAQMQAAPQQRAPAPNPNVQRHAQEWMARNSWYDPSSRDVDSKIAKQLDEALASEGFDPATPDYWDELDNRLQKYLPHRYTGAADSGQQTNRPRNVVGSSGREAAASAGGTSRNSFTLSPERVRAMKDAGAWDNPERRKHMIQKFMEYDRTHRS